MATIYTASQSHGFYVLFAPGNLVIGTLANGQKQTGARSLSRSTDVRVVIRRK